MQTIVTKYYAPTNNRRARLSATSTAGHRIVIPYPDHHLGAHTKHADAVRALAAKIGNLWPSNSMIGGTLNARGDMVWVFIDERSPRT